ncbi:peptide synthase [Streptomyces sp. NBRC 13847]|uniref:fatty acid CoA ligase family protein n=1 Tax=Streptomyces TaxID=1883 RepID=UPI0024A48EE4|nr:fatty acid CoA ligase family protein [Streptomyces sp. NBRC 13847]GLW14744.1 peptide synthase [Streptomyces sp. NBRC 13847]
MSILTEPQNEVLPDLASFLERNARDFPDKPAVRHPHGTEPGGALHYRTLTYGALQEQVDNLAAGFVRLGIGRGTKTVLMASPGPDLFALAFALFRIGAVPVVVDPGMGVRRMLHCYRSVGAEAFIGPPAAHAVRVLSRRTFADARIRVTAGRRWFWGGHTLDELRRPVTSAGEASAAAAGERRPAADDLLMIGFTTGSTGPAKGVEYTHRMAAAMARGIASAHRRSREEVSLVTLPLYGILDLVFGSTLVVAPVAPAKVAGADPVAVVAALERFGVSTMFASPALLRVLGDHLRRRPTALPELRCVVSGGAPVPADLVALLRDVLDDAAEIHTTYGATEALPISSLESAELLGETAARAARGDGTCVGRAVPGVDLRIVRTSDGPLPLWERELGVGTGEVGEIAVAGDAVSRRYHSAPAADALHKIQEYPDDGGAPRIWHRTGDLGSLDDQGRLWFAGRRTQRVTTAGGDLHTVRCEGVFHTHPLVRRTALVGVGAPGAQRPVLCVETEPGTGRTQWRSLVPELRQLADGHPQTRQIQDFLRHPGFPVDPRHNAKIGREQLARWAGRQLDRGARRRRTALRAIPLAGWAFLLVGAVRPFHSPVLTALWWVDAFLSVVVHAAQLPKALPRGRAAGRGAAATVGLTMLYGATWWRTLPPAIPAHPSAGEEAA